MGCTQTKPSMNSPLQGLQKLKMENGYVKGRYAESQRSPDQRHLAKNSGRGKISRPEPRRKSNAGNSGKIANGRSGDRGGGREGKLITREPKKNRGGGSKRITLMNIVGEDKELVDGWPKWLTDNIPRDVLAGIVPRSAESYEKLDKVGQGTYSNVYKARDRDTGKIVALKKVRFDTSEPESVQFMAREIMILQKLDHPNIVKLEGLATSRMQYSLYLVFDYMHSDLSRILSRPDNLSEPQVKCYMYQLLSGLQHCHDRGILHRDIKGSNLLIDGNGMLKIADFGLANFFDPNRNHCLTSRVVTLWYRAPELLLGATEYGIGIDLWSAGCLLAEMFAGRPIMPGRTEVEQLHRIFKLCGTPTEEYWKLMKVSKTFRPPHAYKSRLREAFRDFPASSVDLLNILLALDPSYRGSAGSALQNEFFYTSPLACDLSGLPVIYKEEDEPMQTSERKRQRNSKMRQRSRSAQEHQKKDLALVIPKADSGSSKEETKKSTDLNLQLVSSGTSTSSSIKHVVREWSPPHSLSPEYVSPRKNTSPSSEAHSYATNNIEIVSPFQNAPKTRTIKYDKNRDNMYRLNQVQRSASTREFRKFDQRKLLKLQAVDC